MSASVTMLHTRWLETRAAVSARGNEGRKATFGAASPVTELFGCARTFVKCSNGLGEKTNYDQSFLSTPCDDIFSPEILTLVQNVQRLQFRSLIQLE